MALSDPEYARKKYYSPREYLAKEEAEKARKLALAKENAKAYKALLEQEQNGRD